MNICLYCTCMGQLAAALPEAALREALGPRVRLVVTDCLCGGRNGKPVPADAKGAPFVVAAACSAGARGGEALARMRKSLDGARVGLADIREGCIWPGTQSGTQDLASQAADLVRMAFASLERACAPAQSAVPSAPAVASGMGEALVVGAGPAGMAAASTLAGLGVAVTLAERRPVTGGLLNQLGSLFPRLSGPEAIVASLPLAGVDVRSGVAVTALGRTESGYAATLSDGRQAGEKTFSAVILATGGQPVLPGKRFRAGELRGVISQMELETRLGAVEKGTKDATVLPARAVFVQCVNAREDAAPYCSAICCPTAVKNALRLKRLRPDAAVTVLYRQMVMPGIALEALYRQSMAEGVRFRLVEDMNALRVEGGESIEAVLVPNASSGADATEERIAADCLVCSTPLKPAPATEALAAGLGLRLDVMRFLCGHEPAHPLETGVDGVFLCGTARWPASVEQAVEQGRAAAVLAARFLSERRMPEDEMPTAWSDTGSAAVIRPDLCSGCGRCADACPHGACAQGAEGKSRVDAAACRRCGVCAAVCPCGAARLPGASPATSQVPAVLAALGPNLYRRTGAALERRQA